MQDSTCIHSSVLLVLACTWRLGDSSLVESRATIPAFTGYSLSFAPYEESFFNFATKFNKTYTTQSETSRRFQLFKANLKYMEAHNLKYHHGNSTFFMAPNKFSDLSHDEYLQHNKLGAYALQGHSRGKRSTFDGCYYHRKRYITPPSRDWRSEGAVTRVRDQGQCGSCWIFSANGAMEGQHYLQTGQLTELSEQQVMDCCDDPYCEGCSGGDTTTVYMYVARAGGLESEWDYPYMAQSDKSCKSRENRYMVTTTGCRMTHAGDEEELQNAVGSVGPVSVAVDGYTRSFMNYAGGVYYGENCGSALENLDHGMLVVGYGTTSGYDYWIVKNSWSSQWGVDGYAYMARNMGNNCGIATYASYPITAQPWR